MNRTHTAPTAADVRAFHFDRHARIIRLMKKHKAEILPDALPMLCHGAFALRVDADEIDVVYRWSFSDGVLTLTEAE